MLSWKIGSARMEVRHPKKNQYACPDSHGKEETMVRVKIISSEAFLSSHSKALSQVVKMDPLSKSKKEKGVKGSI